MSSQQIYAMLLAGTLAATACGHKGPRVSLDAPPKPADARSYERILKQWTRYKAITVVKDLNTTLRVYATLQAPEFNVAYVARMQGLFKLPSGNVQWLRRDLQQKWKHHYPFLVVAATHNTDWNDFDRVDSQWRVVLLNDRGQTVEPTRVELQSRVTSTDTALLPHLRAFYKLYHVAFPKRLPTGAPLVRPDTKHLTLRFTGPLGNAELVWRLK